MNVVNVKIKVVSTIFVMTSFTSIQPVLAKNECKTLKIKQDTEKFAREVVVNKLRFPFATFMKTSIDRCIYNSNEDSNLITTRVTWGVKNKRAIYDTTFFFLFYGIQKDYQLLGANNPTREYMMSVQTWFPALTGTGVLASSKHGATYNQGPFK
jgi:uncharacterized protein YhbP (UPF0306 family)